MSKPITTLLGRPIHFSDKVPVLGGEGDLHLVSPYIEIAVTLKEYAAIRAATHWSEIAEIVGMARWAKMEVAQNLGQRVLLGVG